MTKRYYAAYARTDINTGPLYVVRDGDTKTDVSGEMPYHEANDQAGRRNGGEYVSDQIGLVAALIAAAPPMVMPHLLQQYFAAQSEPDNG